MKRRTALVTAAYLCIGTMASSAMPLRQESDAAGGEMSSPLGLTSIYDDTRALRVAQAARPLPSPQEARALLAPSWFVRDVERKAAWLPEEVKRSGVAGAYERRWGELPPDIRSILARMAIPPWLIALIPTAPERQPEIWKQLRFMDDLAGPPPATPLSRRAEQLLIFGGAAQLPTPGDSRSGASLGDEGCSAAMSRYILAELKLEFPDTLGGMSARLTDSQSSSEMKALFERGARDAAAWVQVTERPFSALRTEDVPPGSLMIAQKPGGTHVFGWTRVPAGWRWLPGDKMAIGNTGLAQFGDRMILAQEFLSEAPQEPGERAHNEHGPINSRSAVLAHGRPVLEDPRTNVYFAKGADFIIIQLR